jgi:hypothetical protein
MGARSSEFAFTSVPLSKYFGGWCAAEDTRMDQAGETDAWDAKQIQFLLQKFTGMGLRLTVYWSKKFLRNPK